MNFQGLLMKIFAVYGAPIDFWYIKLGILFFFLAVGFMLYTLVYWKDKKKKMIGLHGFTVFFIASFFILVYPAKVVFGQVLIQVLR